MKRKGGRDWGAAVAKVEQESRCRFCNRDTRGLSQEGLRLETMHLVPRQFDDIEDGVAIVDPDAVVAACGPATDSRSCHGRFDRGEIEALPALSYAEQAAVVRKVGVLSAYTRLTSRFGP